MADAMTREEAFKIFYPKDAMTRPHVEVDYDDSALSNQSGISRKNILFIGSAVAGNPNKVYELNSLAEARSVFQSGDLVEACELAWNPLGNNTQNAGTIYAMRVESATPSTLTQGNLTFTSNVYGTVANGVSVKWDKDALTGAYRLQVVYDVEGYNKLYSNLGNIFSLAYKGDKTAAAYQVDHDENGQATKFHLFAGDTNETEVATFDLTSALYSQMYQLIDAISKVPGFTPVVTGPSTSIPSAFLDATTSKVDLTPTKSGNPVQVTAVVGDLLNQTRNDQYLTVKANLKGTLPEPFGPTNLSGGTDGSVPVSWADKFVQARGNDVYYIVPLTDQANIHAELKAFLNQEDELGYEYRGFVGGGFNEAVNDAISRQVALKEPRIALVDDSGTYLGLNGVQYHIPGYLMAAYVAGVASSLAVGEAVTNKKLNALISLDQVHNGDELDRLDQNGVIGIEYVTNRAGDGIYRIVEDVTTFNSSNEPVKSLVSLGETVDYLLDGVRHYLEDNYIGMSLRVTSADLLRTGVSSYLDTQVASGLIISYNEDDITCSIDGNKAYIIFSCTPTRSLRNILVKTTFDNIELSSNGSSSKMSDYNLAVN